jgi:MoaA/NifB/PqqE/SkfB family radical SAM enzyme
MESIYYVMSWLCHRTCAHCYEDRFRPYHGGDLRRVVEQAASIAPRVIANLPDRLTYLDGCVEYPASVILAGGEILLDPVRETVLYPALGLLRARYTGQGGVKVVVQTTGDTINSRIVDELLARGVWMISVSGIDSFHQGLESENARQHLRDKLTGLFESAGMRLFAPVAADARNAAGTGPFFQFFGATPDLWIGKIWPRGRAMQNELSTAGLADNFCAQWSGGIHFLESGRKGSEVSIEPDGSVYPCCLKTKAPVGNVAEEPLLAILERLRGNPVYEAINAGEPQKMGLHLGWSESRFRENSRVVLPSGRVYENLCVGCDRFHEQVLLAPLVRLGDP